MSIWKDWNIQDALLEVIVLRVLRQFLTSIMDSVLVQHTGARQFADALFAERGSSLYKKVTVTDLALALGIPERTLNARCNDIMKTSPSALIRRMKIDEAKRLLKTGSPTVKEVAYQLGFSSPFHLSQVFKKETGIAPSDWGCICKNK